MKIIFLGGQGSGKSTQAKLLAEKLNLPRVEMGQVLRDKSQGNDRASQLIKAALDKGSLVPDLIAIETLKGILKENEYENGYILDGYPRNAAQMQGLENDIDKVFYIKASDEEAISRLTLRAREDDTNEALTRRLEIYHQETEPLLYKFKDLGILDEVDGERSIEEIHEDILKRMK